MNKIQKQKGALLTMGIVSLVLAVLAIVGGVALIFNGAKMASNDGSNVGSILMVVFGAILCILFVVLLVLGIYGVFVATAIKATQGSVKQGNIAKEGGAVNMRKCDKCGTELKDGDAVCPNCGKKVEDMQK